MKKILIAFLTIIVIFVTFFFIQFQKSRLPISSLLKPTISSVARKNYVEGEVLVVFTPETTFQEAIDFLDNAGFKYKRPYKKLNLETREEIPYEPGDKFEKPSAFTVYVEKGKEKEWIEKIKKNSMIKYVELNNLNVLQ